MNNANRFARYAVLALVSLFSLSAFADDPNIVITSFALAGQQTRAAELCGKVLNSTHANTVRIVSDAETNHPGVYNAIVGADGNFCSVIVTYYGRAEVSLWNLPAAVTKASLSATR